MAASGSAIVRLGSTLSFVDLLYFPQSATPCIHSAGSFIAKRSQRREYIWDDRAAAMQPLPHTYVKRNPHHSLPMIALAHPQHLRLNTPCLDLPAIAPHPASPLTPFIKWTFSLLTAGLLMPFMMLHSARAAETPQQKAEPTAPAADIVCVRDFGAIPDDGKDDVPSIRAAIARALAVHARKIVFEAGYYELDQPTGACLTVKNLNGLTLEGAVNAQGEPATRLVRRHHLETSKQHVPPILAVSGCDGLSLRNLALDNSPQFGSAGYVVGKEKETITVEVLPGLPVIEGVGPYCANLWDPRTRMLRKVPSVTYGNDVDAHRLIWRKASGGEGRRLSLTGDYVASKVEVGDLMSWHFGYRGSQVQISECRDVQLSNLLTVNGYPLVTHHCTNVRANRIVFRPEGNQLSVGPRDAWFIWAGRGEYLIEDMHCEGVRWDGQNVHGSFLKLKQRVNDHTVTASKSGGTNAPIEPGSKVGFWNDPKPVERTVSVAQTKLVEGLPEVTLTFTEALPAFAGPDTLISIYDWDIASYTLRNCVFRNIAGCASIIRNRTALFDHCAYDHIMYPAILLGASVAEGEGTFPQDVTIRDCTFRASGWASRHGTTGCVGIRNVGAYGIPGDGLGRQKDFRNTGERNIGEDGPYMGRIRLTGNQFEDSDLGIAISHAREVILKGNVFKNVATPYALKPGDMTEVIEE
jgi:hypothetical protein